MVRLITRYTTFYLVIAATVFFLILSIAGSAWWLLPTAIFASLVVLGFNDLNQTAHAIRRNYPVLGNMRFLFEYIRPEIRQYFFEDDT